jgi:tetratricopeptide (TPR) repeat protein
MRHVSDLDPENLGELGAYLADRGRPEEAQAVYEEWLQKSRDQVGIANDSLWLVRRYHELGEADRAEALATRVAAVGSYSGLMTLGDLYDWRGRAASARRMYEKAAARYDANSDLLGFYLRRVDQDPSLTPEIERITPQIFPRGIERVALPDLTIEPSDGVRFFDVGDTGRRSGLRNYDIVVAVDGIRVHNLKQFRVARRASVAPEMHMIVWRAGQYVEVAAPLRLSWPVQNSEDYVHGRAAVATR